MQHEWNQTDYFLENCPFHGYRITQIPVRPNYGINIYSNINQPTIFPYERNIIHDISNYSLRNPNQDYPYNIVEYSNPIYQKEINNKNKYSTNYSLKPSCSEGDYTDNYTFYISGSSRLKPRVTINNMRADYNSNTPNIYNYNYTDNRRRQRTIVNNNNSNGYLMPKVRRYDIANTEPEEIYNNTYNNRRRNYYLTPNYYNNDDEDEIKLDVKTYHLNRNINNENIIDYNINERRIVTENNLLPSKRRVINGYKNNMNYNYKMEDIRHMNISGNEKNNGNPQIVRIRKIYKNKEKEIPDKIKKYYTNKNKTNPKEEDNKVLLINKNINKNIKKYEEKNNNKVKVRITNLNNHRFYISKNDKVSIQNLNNMTLMQQRPVKISKYFLEKINKNIKENKDLFNKTNIIEGKNPLYNDVNIIQNKSKNAYAFQLRKDKAKNKIIIKPKEIKNNKKYDFSNNVYNIQKGGNEKIEKQIEKYYDSQGNLIGGKNVIIKKRYKENGEKIVKEIIKESYKPNFNDIFKKYIPKEVGANESKKEVGKNKQNVQEKNDIYYPFQINCDKLEKKENVENNNIIEEKNDEMRNVTFGIKSQSIRFEEETKDEKEADEQEILINSEYEADTTKTINEDKNDEKKLIDNDNDKKYLKENNIHDLRDVNNGNEIINNKEEIKKVLKMEEIKEDLKMEEIKEDLKMEEIKEDLKSEVIKDNNKKEIKEYIKLKEIKENNKEEIKENNKEEIKKDLKSEEIKENNKQEIKEDYSKEEIKVDTKLGEIKEDYHEEEIKEDINKEEIEGNIKEKEVTNNAEAKIEEKIDNINIINESIKEE